MFKLMCVFIAMCFTVTASLQRLTSNVVSQSIKTGGLQRGAPSNGQLAGGVGEPPIHFSLLPLLDLDLGAGVSGLHVLPETSL